MSQFFRTALQFRTHPRFTVTNDLFDWQTLSDTEKQDVKNWVDSKPEDNIVTALERITGCDEISVDLSCYQSIVRFGCVGDEDEGQVLSQAVRGAKENRTLELAKKLVWGAWVETITTKNRASNSMKVVELDKKRRELTIFKPCNDEQERWLSEQFSPLFGTFTQVTTIRFNEDESDDGDAAKAGLYSVPIQKLLIWFIAGESFPNLSNVWINLENINGHDSVLSDLQQTFKLCPVLSLQLTKLTSSRGVDTVVKLAKCLKATRLFADLTGNRLLHLECLGLDVSLLHKPQNRQAFVQFINTSALPKLSEIRVQTDEAGYPFDHQLLVFNSITKEDLLNRITEYVGWFSTPQGDVVDMYALFDGLTRRLPNLTCVGVHRWAPGFTHMPLVTFTRIIRMFCRDPDRPNEIKIAFHTLSPSLNPVFNFAEDPSENLTAAKSPFELMNPRPINHEKYKPKYYDSLKPDEIKSALSAEFGFLYDGELNIADGDATRSYKFKIGDRHFNVEDDHSFKKWSSS